MGAEVDLPSISMLRGGSDTADLGVDDDLWTAVQEQDARMEQQSLTEQDVRLQKQENALDDLKEQVKSMQEQHAHLQEQIKGMEDQQARWQVQVQALQDAMQLNAHLSTQLNA